MICFIFSEKTTNNPKSSQKIGENNCESNNLDSMEEMSIDLNKEKRDQIIIDNNFGKVNKEIKTNNNLINDKSFETISETNINSNQNECKLRTSERKININAFYSSNDSDSDDFHPFSEEQSLLCNNECLDECNTDNNRMNSEPDVDKLLENTITHKLNDKKSYSIKRKNICDFIGSEKRIKNGSNCILNLKRETENKNKEKYKRNEELLVCDHNKCLLHFNDQKYLRIHQLRSHPEMFPDIAFIKCEKKGCNYRTKYKIAMNQHLTRHPELNPNSEQFKCKQIGCNYSTKVKRNFVQHKCGHSLPFSCDVCQSRFKDRDSLQTHVLAKHINKRPFVCSFYGCVKSYFSKLSLKRHEKTHEGVKYKCDWNNCGKEFISYSTYCKHVQKHGTKKFKCHSIECNKEFWTQYDLKEHMNTHTGNKPYVCEWPGCEKRFATNTYLHIHKRYHINERKHVCDWPECNYATNNGSNLVKHKAIHTGDLKYSCFWPNCEYKTSNHSNLVTHQKQHK